MTDPTVRPRRELETRAASASDEYTPPSTLPVPNMDPGFAYRWVATHLLGEVITSHFSKQAREGWVPVEAKNHPELGLPGNRNGNVEVGGLLLCRMPMAKAEARKRYYENMTAQQMHAVDANLRSVNDARMPMFAERKSQATRGGGFGSGRTQ